MKSPKFHSLVSMTKYKQYEMDHSRTHFQKPKNANFNTCFVAVFVLKMLK